MNYYERDGLTQFIFTKLLENDGNTLVCGSKGIGKTEITNRIVLKTGAAVPEIPCLRFDFTGVTHDASRGAINEELLGGRDVINSMNEVSANQEFDVKCLCIFDNFEKLNERRRQNYRQFMQDCNHLLSNRWNIALFLREHTFIEYDFADIFGPMKMNRINIPHFSNEEMYDIFEQHPKLGILYRHTHPEERAYLHHPRYLKIAHKIIDQHPHKQITGNNDIDFDF